MDDTLWELVIFAGRLLFAFLFIGSGIGHLTQTAAMAGYAESRGLKNGTLMVQLSGVALLLGGASVVLGIFGDIGALGLAVLMVVTAVTMHAFWKETDPMAKQMEMVGFNKDIALAGAALFMWVYFHFDFVPWTITDPLFNGSGL